MRSLTNAQIRALKAQAQMQKRLKTVLLPGLLSISIGWFCTQVTAEPVVGRDCAVKRQGSKVELQSPMFAYGLDTADGLRAEWFENRLTGRKLSLGRGRELDMDLGPLGGPLATPKWRVAESPRGGSAAAGEAVFTLVAEGAALSARVTYRWNAAEPVLRKFIEIRNTGERERWLLNLRLGSYRTEAKLVDREQGFPVYLDDQFFMSLAHPAGWATATNSEASLRQYPGTKLAAWRDICGHGDGVRGRQGRGGAEELCGSRPQPDAPRGPPP